MIRFLHIVTALFMLIAARSFAFPLLDKDFLELQHAAATMEDREGLLQVILIRTGLPAELTDAYVSLVLSDDLEAKEDFAVSILSDPDRSAGQEFVAIIARERLGQPGRVGNFFLEYDQLSNPKIVLDPNWSTLAYFAEQALHAPLPLSPMSEKNEKYLSGYLTPLDEELIDELKTDIYSYARLPAAELAKDMQQLSDMQQLITILLAQEYDPSFVNSLLRNEIYPSSGISFVNYMSWQNDKRYLADTLSFCASLNNDSLARHQDMLYVILNFLKSNIKEESVKEFIVETLSESPGVYYQILPRLAEQLLIADSLTRSQRARLQKQAQTLSKASQTMFELQNLAVTGAGELP